MIKYSCSSAPFFIGSVAGGRRRVRNKPFIFKIESKVLHDICPETYSCRGIKWYILQWVYTYGRCKGRSYGKCVCFAIGDMDPIYRQGIIRGPSAGVAPVAMRYRVCFSTAFVPQLQLWQLCWLLSLQSLVELHCWWHNCCISQVTGTLLRLSKHE